MNNNYTPTEEDKDIVNNKFIIKRNPQSQPEWPVLDKEKYGEETVSSVSQALFRSGIQHFSQELTTFAEGSKDYLCILGEDAKDKFYELGFIVDTSKVLEWGVKKRGDYDKDGKNGCGRF
ncbi:MAG TPA: hypothetical protein DIV86_01050 [Alphaproteobacteria bacterium]|nr:hypothetical protein [Alphaproteobacteria bacterium]